MIVWMPCRASMYNHVLIVQNVHAVRFDEQQSRHCIVQVDVSIIIFVLTLLRCLLTASCVTQVSCVSS